LGSPQLVVQDLISIGWQNVLQAGAEQDGVQTSSHAGESQSHLQEGVQGGSAESCWRRPKDDKAATPAMVEKNKTFMMMILSL